MHTYKASVLGNILQHLGLRVILFRLLQCMVLLLRCTNHSSSFCPTTYQFGYITLQSTPNAVNKHSPQTHSPTIHGHRSIEIWNTGKLSKWCEKLFEYSSTINHWIVSSRPTDLRETSSSSLKHYRNTSSIAPARTTQVALQSSWMFSFLSKILLLFGDCPIRLEERGHGKFDPDDALPPNANSNLTEPRNSWCPKRHFGSEKLSIFSHGQWHAPHREFPSFLFSFYSVKRTSSRFLSAAAL